MSIAFLLNYISRHSGNYYVSLNTNTRQTQHQTNIDVQAYVCVYWSVHVWLTESLWTATKALLLCAPNVCTHHIPSSAISRISGAVKASNSTYHRTQARPKPDSHFSTNVTRTNTNASSVPDAPINQWHTIASSSDVRTWTRHADTSAPGIEESLCPCIGTLNNIWLVCMLCVWHV